MGFRGLRIFGGFAVLGSGWVLGIFKFWGGCRKQHRRSVTGVAALFASPTTTTTSTTTTPMLVLRLRLKTATTATSASATANTNTVTLCNILPIAVVIP